LHESEVALSARRAPQDGPDNTELRRALDTSGDARIARQLHESEVALSDRRAPQDGPDNTELRRALDTSGDARIARQLHESEVALSARRAPQDGPDNTEMMRQASGASVSPPYRRAAPTDYSQQLRTLVQRFHTLDRVIVKDTYHKANFDFTQTVKWLEDLNGS